MDLITLSNGKEYTAEFAALSIMTGNFNARLQIDDLPMLVKDFSESEKIIVDNESTGRKEYVGYTRFTRILLDDGAYLITLAKEG